MARQVEILSLLALIFTATTAQAQDVVRADTSPHKASFVIVDKDVRLEVLDWGGKGTPLILLPGGGDTAHVYDQFALNFISSHHVYAITRRGFGASTKPAPTKENYDSNRLGDDVLAVMSALKIERPFLAGHSASGRELSSIGSRHPDQVAGLIYLDAAQPFALYTPKNPAALILEANRLRNELDAFNYGPSLVGAISDVAAQLPQFEKHLTYMQNRFASGGISRLPPGKIFTPTPENEINAAMDRGEHEYSDIECPVLAIFAIGPDDRAADSPQQIQSDAFAALPKAKVVKLANAEHYIYRSNQADVVREMNAFMDGSPTSSQ